MRVHDPRPRLRERHQLVVVGREERARLGAPGVVQILGDRPGDREPVEGRSAAADLVEDDEASPRDLGQDLRRLAHLDHERRLAAGQPIRGADAGEDAVDDADPRRLRRHEAPDLREQHDQRDLPQVGALARHVGSREQQDLGASGIELRVVRDEAVRPASPEHRLDHRVTPRLDLEPLALVDDGPDPAFAARDFRERRHRVERRHPIRRLADLGTRLSHPQPQRLEDLALELRRALRRPHHPRLDLAQSLGREALDVGERLLALVVGGHLRELRFRDLEGVAVDRMESHLQTRDAAALALLGLETGDPLAALRKRFRAARRDHCDSPRGCSPSRVRPGIRARSRADRRSAPARAVPRAPGAARAQRAEAKDGASRRAISNPARSPPRAVPRRLAVARAARPAAHRDLAARRPGGSPSRAGARDPGHRRVPSRSRARSRSRSTSNSTASWRASIWRGERSG